MGWVFVNFGKVSNENWILSFVNKQVSGSTLITKEKENNKANQIHYLLMWKWILAQVLKALKIISLGNL